MATITIYATAKHKQKESMGCSAYQIFKGKSKKPSEKLNQFQSESKISTQLSTLIQSVQSLKSSDGIEEVKLHTDFSLIQDFLNGTVLDWEKNNWARPSGRPIPHADLWKEFSDLCSEYNVQLIATEEADENMADLSRKVLNESKKSNKTTGKKSAGKNKTTPLPTLENEIDNTPLENQLQLPEVLAPAMVEIEKEISTPKVASPSKPVSTSTEEVSEKITKKIGGNIKVDESLKQECEELFQKIGFDVDVAVTMFLKHSLRKNGLTLDLIVEE